MVSRAWCWKVAERAGWMAWAAVMGLVLGWWAVPLVGGTAVLAGVAGREVGAPESPAWLPASVDPPVLAPIDTDPAR
jgi:hypothetical protein